MPCLQLGACQGGWRQPVWGDSPAGMVGQRTWGSRWGDAVHPAQGVAEGRAAPALTEGAFVVKCCVMGGFSYTVPKVSPKSPYFCIFSLNLEPPWLLPTPSKLCITTWMG